MPEEVRRRAAAGRDRVGKNAARDGERTRDARRDERRELRLVACRDTCEERRRDAVHEREARHVNRDRSLFGQNERAGGKVEECVLGGLENRTRVERERGGIRHRRRVRERAARVHDDRVGKVYHVVGEGKRSAAVHRRRAVTERARELHGREAAVQNRAARMLLLAVLHDHLALALLHDLAGFSRGAGVERHDMPRRVDRERIAVQVEPPVVLLRSI